MTAINAAWELIGEPSRRTEFDRRRALDTATPGGAAHPGGVAQAGGATQPGATARAASGGTAAPRPPETVSRDWTSGRSTFGGGYDSSMHRADGAGAAGRPPGNPSGSVLNFGRYAGWSLGEIGRLDLEYLEWLDRMPIGRPYRDEIDALLRTAGLRRSADPAASERRGLFRRR